MSMTCERESQPRRSNAQGLDWSQSSCDEGERHGSERRRTGEAQPIVSSGKGKVAPIDEFENLWLKWRPMQKRFQQIGTCPRRAATTFQPTP